MVNGYDAVYLLRKRRVGEKMGEMPLGDLDCFAALGHCIREAAAGQPDLVSAMHCKYGNRNAVRRGGRRRKYILDVFCNFSL